MAIYLIAAAITFVLTLTLGIILACGYGDDFCKPNAFCLLKIGEYGYFSSLFKYLLFGVLAVAAALCALFKRWFIVIPFIYFGFLGYKCGVLIVGACNVAFVAGIASALLIYLPIYLAIVGVACFVTAYCARYPSCCKTMQFCKLREALTYCLYALIVLTTVILIFAVILPAIVALICF